jgi:hypothetical protein
VIAFLFADLLILPILNIYRKYYGLKVAAILAGVFYVAMAGAALVVEGLFAALHLIPVNRGVAVMQETIRWNYTSVLNVAFLAASAVLLVRFLKTGGPAMLREMGNGPADPSAEPHNCCHEEPAAVAAAKPCCHEEPVATKSCCCHEEPAPAVAKICCHEEPAAAVEAKHSCCHAEPVAVAKGDCCHAEAVGVAEAPEQVDRH